MKLRATNVISLALLCMAVACSFEDSITRCQVGGDDCPINTRCYEGFCIQSDPDSTSSPQTGSDAGPAPSRPNGGRGGTASSTGGRGGGGSARPNDAGTGPTQPTIPADASVGGECSRADEERPCLVDPASTILAEACNRGTQVCLDGAWSACAPQPMPEAETCNGLDDDCNGEVDNLTETCYPDGEAGCTRGADGTWSCTGTCGTGTRTCRDGMLGACERATTPVEDTCTAEGEVARNEDCDEMVDEGCECRNGETRTCWSGRADRMDVGKCKSGMQTCAGGAFGACMGEVHADAETCANPNVDDDCNGTADDVPTVGNRCQVMGAQGPCAAGTLRCMGSGAAPTCVSTSMPSPEVCNGLDDDCNGRADEGFNLRRDAQNCGACGNRCGSGESCCAGRCVNPTNNNDHCGACGESCEDGERCRNGTCMSTMMPMGGMPAGGAGTGGMSGSPAGGAGSPGMAGTGGSGGGSECTPACAAGETCCNGTCVNLMTNKDNCNACGNVCPFADSGCCNGNCVNLLDGATCGSCNNDCSLLTGDDGALCMCLKDGSGTIGCRGSLLNLQLCLL